VQELVMIGFTEKRRAIEVLPQLQRLQFEWSSDLQTAIAVEVERDGKLRLHQSQLLDPEREQGDIAPWKAILNAITPLPHVRPEHSQGVANEIRAIYAESTEWLKDVALDRDFVRNAAAILRPGNSAILAVLRDFRSAWTVLSGYSQVVLHTTFKRDLRAHEFPSE
jgi:uncharacterized membrane protein